MTQSRQRLSRAERTVAKKVDALDSASRELLSCKGGANSRRVVFKGNCSIKFGCYEVGLAKDRSK